MKAVMDVVRIKSDGSAIRFPSPLRTIGQTNTILANLTGR